MLVDLTKKEEFDTWFGAKQAPERLTKWKTHFDKWATKRITSGGIPQD